MAGQDLDSPLMRQQRILLYVLPLIFGVGGIFFPIGVLVYWTVSNLWTLGQQSLVSRRP
jgi:YidC/Oxa1 family membrane protein insertase